MIKERYACKQNAKCIKCEILSLKINLELKAYINEDALMKIINNTAFLMKCFAIFDKYAFLFYK